MKAIIMEATINRNPQKIPVQYSQKIENKMEILHILLKYSWKVIQ